MWGEIYQGLLKRVGASLERLKILERKEPERTGQDRFMKTNEHRKRRKKRDMANAFRSDKLNSLPPERTWSRQRVMVSRPTAHSSFPNPDSRTGRVSSQKLKGALVHKRPPMLAGTSPGIFSDTRA